MTSPVTVQTEITRKIINHFRMDDRDIDILRQQILAQLRKSYLQTITQQLNLYGCQKLASLSDAASIQWLEAKAAKDSESIARTYQNQLENEVQRIYSKNHKSNRYAYMAQLDVWIARRNVHKSASISLNTMTAAREYAQNRFIEENNIKGLFVLTGPPPVCRKCLLIKGNGPKPFRFTQKPENRLPAHIGCPHRYSELIPSKIDCQTVWTG